MGEKRAVKKFAGVYFTESKMRRWRERPDRCYSIMFRDLETGKLRWERCGWASDGWTPEAAQRRRHELLESDRAGDYKPKQERKLEKITFGELMTRYLEWADENKKRARDDRSLNKNWLEPLLAGKTLSSISPLDLERIKKNMRDAGKSEATQRHALCLVRQTFNKAIEWRLWTGENPCKSIRFPRPNNARQRFLSYDEADRLMEALEKKSTQIPRIAKMSLYSGMRLSEIFSLRWSSVDLRNNIITVLDAKNGESRPIFITDQIRAVLDDLTPGPADELLFKTKQGKPVAWLSKSFGDVVTILGLNKGLEDRRQKITFHSLRHTFASWAAMSGIPLFVIGQALGHRTSIMTQRYAHLSPDSQRAAFEAVARFSEQAKEAEAVENAD
jgi:integrase